MTAMDLIAALQLKPLPLEGGYYRETYRCDQLLAGSSKSVCTAIYYLLTPESFSALHRLPTDEVFHFYLGSPVRMLQLLPDGDGCLLTLGTDLAAGERPQILVPRNVWQGSLLAPGGSFALLGTTMAPGFDFSDYQAADRELLVARYPLCTDLIRQLTIAGRSSTENEQRA